MPTVPIVQDAGMACSSGFVERRAKEAPSDTPVILVVGPRWAGKTTLVRKMGKAGRTYITPDDQTALEAAQSGPVGFIRGLDLAIIDEIQRAPDLLLAIKKTVDEDYRLDRFLLTGSANVLTLPQIADSLAGRIEAIQMLPLAKAEIEGQMPTFLERLFDGKLQRQRNAFVGDDLVQLVLLGGFPEASSRNNERRRQDWAHSYLTSILRAGGRTRAHLQQGPSGSRNFWRVAESFVFSEVLKLLTASDLRLTPHHFRDRDMREIDIVLERDDGMIAGIEVKASAAVRAGDFAGLRALAAVCGDRFAFGVVLYDSTDVVQFGDRLAAAPLSCLWG